ncbi:hypothetical protein ACU8DI_00420 [Psychroserpens sp. BH13MA-6]
MLKKINLRIVLILLITLLIFVLSINDFFWKVLDFNYKNFKAEKVDKQKLAQYYDVFRMTYYFQNNTEKEFLEFVKLKDEKFFESLSRNEIKLYLVPEIRRTVDLEGVYYISNKVDKELYLYDFSKYQFNMLYGIKDGLIFPLKKISRLEVLSKIIDCDPKRIKLDLFSLESNLNADLKKPDYYFIKFEKGQFQFTEGLDEEYVKVLSADEDILNYSNDYDTVFLQINFEESSKYYCDESVDSLN